MPTSGLVGHWTLDETSGSTIRDYSPSANNGTWTDAVNNDVAEETIIGQVDNALSFDNNVDSITVGNPAELQITGGLTIAAWARPTSSHDGHILAKWDWPNEDNASYRLQTDTVGGSSIDYEFRVYSGTCGSTSSNRSGEVTVTTNEWHHIVGVYEPSTAVRLYVDGVLASEDTVGIAASLANCANNVTIGTNTGPTLQEWEGDLDDIRVYNRALNATEITNLYQNTGGNDTSLSLHFKLDETGGSTAADSSIYGNDGTWAGSPGIVGGTGRINGAVDFYDNDWVINAGSDASIDDVFLNGGTIAAWIRPTQTPFYDYGRIVSKMTDRPNNGGYSIYTSIEATAPQSVWFAQGFGGSSVSRWSTPAGSLNMQVWNHVAVVYDQENPTDAPTIYLNGIEQSLTLQETGTGSADSDAAENFLVGVATIGNDNFEGQLDDIRVYRRMLSANEVQSLYAACQEGSMIYNAEHHVPQYCAGNDNWVAMGPVRDGIDSGLVGHWQLDETSGLVAGDASENGYNGTMQNGLDASTSTADGKVGTALSFDGSDDGISLGDINIVAGESEASVCAWAFVQAASISKDHDIFTDENSSNGMLLWVDDEGALSGIQNTLAFTINPGIGANGRVEGPAESATANEWIHLCGTFKGEQFLRLYKNGLLINENTTNTPSVVESSGTGVARIGTRNGAGATNFGGLIDDVRVYNRTLSHSEVMAIYELGNDNGSSLYGHWKLDELSGTTASDSSGNTNDGTLTNFDSTPSWSSSGQVGGALSFDGIDDKIDVGTLFDYAANDFTIAGWIYVNELSTTDQNTIFGGWNGVNQVRFEIDSDAQNCTDDYLRLTYYDGGAFRQRCSASQIVEDTWVHVALVVDATNSVVSFYLNGTNDGSNPALSDPIDGGSGNSTIGARTNDTQHFNGLIDDMRIYDRALSDNEIDALYKLGTGNCTNPEGKEGDVIMNDIDPDPTITDNALLYCDGVNWQTIGKTP